MLGTKTANNIKEFTNHKRRRTPLRIGMMR
jgi:hypothetical protein